MLLTGPISHDSIHLLKVIVHFVFYLNVCIVLIHSLFLIGVKSRTPVSSQF